MSNTPHPYQWAVDGPPFGIWQTAGGSFDVVQKSRIAFNPNGTGEIIDGNAFGFDVPRTFEWIHKSAGVLSVFVFDSEISNSENANERSNEINWESIDYTTDIIETDVGTIPVLWDVNPSFPDSFPVAFWYTNNPITLVSRHEEP